MKRLLFLVTAITLVAAFGVVSTGCMCSAPPSNADVKKAVIAYERGSGTYLTEADIEIIRVGSAHMIPQLPPITVYPVAARIMGKEHHYQLSKIGNKWTAVLVP